MNNQRVDGDVATKSSLVQEIIVGRNVPSLLSLV